MPSESVQKIQCALYQCAAPSPTVTAQIVQSVAHVSSDDVASKTLLPFYDEKPSRAYTPLPEDYRGDCMLFVAPRTTYASLITQLQARLNKYMILHGSSPSLSPSPSASPPAATERQDASLRREQWPLCRTCHVPSGFSTSEGTPSAQGRPDLTPSLFVCHAHVSTARSHAVRKSDLPKRWDSTRRSKQTPRYAFYFHLVFLPTASPIARALQQAVNSLDRAPSHPADTAAATSTRSDAHAATERHFLHLKAAGHMMRLGVQEAEDTLVSAVRTVAERRRLEVTRVVLDNEPHKPALFPCEAASVVAHAVPYARVVVNKRMRPDAGSTGTAVEWRYGDTHTVAGTLPVITHKPLAPPPHDDTLLGSVSAIEASPWSPGSQHGRSSGFSEPVHYYGPYSQRDGGVDRATVISYSSLSTTTDQPDAFQGGSGVDGPGDTRISLGTFTEFSDLSLSQVSRDSSDSNNGSDAQQETSGTDREEAFVVSLRSSQVNASTSSSEDSDESAPHVANRVTSSTEEIEETTEEGSSELEDVAMTVPLRGPAPHHATAPDGDALWNLNNDFVFEVDDGSMSPPRTADQHAAGTAFGSPDRGLPRSPDGSAEAHAAKTPSSSGSTHRKPRLVVVSSPSSNRHSSHSGSSGVPTPAHPPRQFRPDYTAELRWHFTRENTDGGLLAGLSRQRTSSSTYGTGQGASGVLNASPVSADDAIISIVGDPTVTFSQPPLPPTQGDTQTSTPSRRNKRQRSSSLPQDDNGHDTRTDHGRTRTERERTPPQRDNVLDETPTEIALQQDHVGSRAVRGGPDPHTHMLTPPTVRQPRRRSPILFSPGDMIFSDHSSLRGRESPSSHTALTAPQAFGGISPALNENTPDSAIAYFAPQDMDITASASPRENDRGSDTEGALSSSSSSSSGDSSQSPVSPIAELHHTGTGRGASAVMVTQQAMPEYTLPDGNESTSSEEGSSRSESSTDSDDGDDGTDDVLGGEQESSDDSDYVFTGL